MALSKTNERGEESMKSVSFGNKIISENTPAFLIAEAGLNHNGDVDLAKKLIEAAHAAGADAVKFQNFNIFKSCELPPVAFKQLSDHAKKVGIIFFSTPFDLKSVDVLEGIGVPGYKVASCDLTNVVLLKRVAQCKKPILLSTGMGTAGEIFQALDVLRQNGNSEVALFHCVSHYPTELEHVNLKTIPYMRDVFQVPVGISDHTLGVEVPIASIAIGSKMIEKHFTLDKNLPGPDHQLSADPKEFKIMMETVRRLEKALGEYDKKPVESKEHIAILRRSLVANTKIKAGSVLTKEMIAIKRPGNGIPSIFYESVVGRVTKKSIEEDELIDWAMLQ
jgi:N-acetylneuraminate synthase/N,N'-diacetyllegionaminate synthase